ncbi:MAG: HAD family hydrolase [Chloroflexi bacterium]|nr:MAG: HAD family hydrolase [Chloroflexota bacterium]
MRHQKQMSNLPISNLPISLSPIEIIRPDAPRGPFRRALFDFDGTVSLIRQGWPEVMVAAMLDILRRDLPSNGTDMAHFCADLVARTTGQPILAQMTCLADEIARRGGTPGDPRAYKQHYLARLRQNIQHRLTALEQNPRRADSLLVPGVVDFLAALQSRGIPCDLLSGTDRADVVAEARLLGVDRFFEAIYGPEDGTPGFSKQQAIDHILHQNGLAGPELVAFGDGPVETANVAAVGGLAVGVASNEAERQGIDAGKRRRLIRSGAHLIIPDFRAWAALLEFLGLNS